MHKLPTRVLLVDDSEADRATFRFFLEQQKPHKYSIQDVSTAEEAIAVCTASPPDCVLLDYRLPDTDGITLVERLRRTSESSNIAIVFLSGSGDELLAARALKSGAQDYLPKTAATPELLSRALENALDKVNLDVQQRRAQTLLEENERRLRAIVSTVPGVVYIFDLQRGCPTFASEYSTVVTGYSPAEVIAMGERFGTEVIYPDDQPIVAEQFRRLQQAPGDEEFECEYRVRHKNGSLRYLLSRDRVFDRDANGVARCIVGAATDITEKRATEAALRDEHVRIGLAEKAAKIGFWDWDIGKNEASCSAAYSELYGCGTTAATVQFEEWLSRIHPEDRAGEAERVRAALGGAPYDSEFRVIWPDGSVHWLGARATPVWENGRPVRFVGANIDITQRKDAEEQLRQAHERLQILMDVVPAAIFIANDADSTRIEGNRMAYDLLELPIGANASKTAPIGQGPANFRVVKGGAEIDGANLPIQTVARTGQPIFGHECEVEFTDGRRRCLFGNVLPLSDAAGQPAGALAAYLDSTDRKRIEQELRRSNEDLEHFASMAGHDLQEPLRSIVSFAEYLSRLPNLPVEITAPLEFIRTGADRMKNLILDLLAYAQTATEARRTMTMVSVSEALRDALIDLKTAIRENDARIVYGPLPSLAGNQVQLTQLFQNLVGNGLKYRSEDRRPEIEITAEKQPNDWLFAVRDNGIGIDMQHADLIFEPFKRLHTREKYSGTGIGLAICRRIVEQHGGRIWVESHPGEGSVFLFSLPDRRGVPDPMGRRDSGWMPAEAIASDPPGRERTTGS